MKPLAWVALGSLLLLMHVTVSGYDVLPDPVGWLLIGAGTGMVPFDPSIRRLLLGLAGAAGVISAALWVPEVTAWLADGDPGLAWAAEVPKFLFFALLAHHLARRAAGIGEDPGAAFYFRVVMVAAIIALLLPILWIGADFEALAQPSMLAAGGTFIVMALLGFLYAGVEWVTPEASSDSPPP